MVELESFDIYPHVDPYRTGYLTYPACWLDPERRVVYVEQHDESGSTTFYRWYKRETEIDIYGADDVPPDADALRAYLLSDNTQRLLDTICDHYETVWDGNNTCGHYDNVAQALLVKLEEEIAELPRETVETWFCESWFNGEENYYLREYNTPHAAAQAAQADAKSMNARFADNPEVYLERWYNAQSEKD